MPSEDHTPRPKPTFPGILISSQLDNLSQTPDGIAAKVGLE